MSESREPDNQTSEQRIGRILNEFHDRRARGERVSEAELLAAHPDLAEELKPFLGMLDELHEAGHGVRRWLPSGSLSDDRDSTEGVSLGDYKTLGFLGRGGMGLVLKAHEERLNRTVALKILRPELADNAASRQRFTREARSVGMIRHPNIVTVYGVGSHEGTPYLSMEYIDGPTLADVIREEAPLEGDRIRRIFREILSGLSAAHAKKLIHRDIKSANILLDGSDQQAKITDFGLARLMNSQTRITLPESTPGTPEYMSPEQARGDEDIDHRTDLYSAGVVLYEMLTGRTPFKAEAPAAIIHQILSDMPIDVQERNPHADPHLASLAMRLIAKGSEDRFDSVEEVLAALDEGERVQSPEQRRRLRRRAQRVAIVACLLFGGVWLAGRALRVGSDDRRSPTASRLISQVWIDEEEPQNKAIVMARFGDNPSERILHDFESEAEGVECVKRVDLNGNGDVIAIAGLENAEDGCNLVALNSQGDVTHRINISSKRHWPDCAPPTNWNCTAMAVANMDGKPGDEIVFTGCDAMEYATRISILDPRTWQMTATFWHMGNISELTVLEDFFGDQHHAIVALGNNNKLDGFMHPLPGDAPPVSEYDRVEAMMILDPRNMDGLGPPRTAQIDIPPVMPYSYAWIELVVGMDIRKWSDPPGAKPHRTPLEVACVDSINPNQYDKKSDDGLRISLRAWSSSERAKGDGLGILTVNKHLELQHVVVTNDEGGVRTEAYWREHWRTLIREYEYLPHNENRLNTADSHVAEEAHTKKSST